MIGRYVEAAVRATAFGAVLVVIAACGSAQQAQVPPPSSYAVSPPARSVIDPRAVILNDPGGHWKVVNHEIRRDRQRLDLQPVDETFEYPNDCTGCNHPSATAAVTVYERGAYDQAAVITGQEVTVNGEPAYYIEPRWPAGAVLAWRYDGAAWATVQGRSRTTGNLERLQDLAERLQPAARTPVRFPLRVTTLPEDMPLSGV